MRLIDAYALIAEMHNVILEDGEDRRTFYEVIERQPTIEERKTGKWIDAKYPFSKCNVCGIYFDTANNVGNFCQNCGADMRGKQDETD